MQGAGSPEIRNIILPVANTEYVVNLNPGVKKLLLQAREGGDLKIAFKQGQSSINYFTLRGFNTYFEDLITGPFTIAMQSPHPNSVVEMVCWYRYD